MHRPTSALARQIAFAIPTALAMLFASAQTEATASTPNPETLHSFVGGADGSTPNSELFINSKGVHYGTTQTGGKFGKGTLFALTPLSNGTFKEVILHDFGGTIPNGKKPLADGAHAIEGVVADKAGNIYGITDLGGTINKGTVFKYNPVNGAYTLIYNNPFEQSFIGELVVDTIKGVATPLIVSGSDARVSQMLALKESKGVWTSSAAEQFPAGGSTFANTAVDTKGNALFIKHNLSGVSQLVMETPPTSGTGRWKPTLLHTFTGKAGDFHDPSNSLIVDSEDKVYGLATGTSVTVWELAPQKNATLYKPTTLLTFQQNVIGGASNLTFDNAGGFYVQAIDYNNGGEIQHILPPTTKVKSWTAQTVYDPKKNGFAIRPGTVANGMLVGTTATTVFQYKPVSPP